MNKILIFPKGTLNRYIRDVLMRLHHWHIMMFDWYRIAMKGENQICQQKKIVHMDNKLSEDYIFNSFIAVPALCGKFYLAWSCHQEREKVD